MRGKPAKLIYLCICVLIAILLLTQVISPIVGGFIFASALLILGSLSKGFKRL